MAGTYPDVPGYRFSYDKDGTGVFTYASAGGSISTISSNDTRKLNNSQLQMAYYSFDPLNYTGVGNNWLAFMFPENRNILGYFVSIIGGLVGSLETSTDTTNGQDGTWATRANPFVYIIYHTDPVSPKYRTNIQAANWTGIRAIRFNFSGRIAALHLYGSIALAQSPDRLRIVDLSDNDIAAQLDFGDIRQRNNVTKQFKVINNSSTKTANNITVSMDTNPDAAPSLIGQYQLSTDNTAFANAINIGTLAPGASSGTLYIRDTISATAQLGLWTVQLIASPNTWS